MAQVMFKKGLLASLPATYAEGTFYVTTDERGLYLDISNEARIRLGDFQEFATIAALEANANPSTSALYYVADINCLAKWDGAKYVQINRDTGMTSVEVTGSGNAVTAAVYSADGRKLTLTKGATFMTSADVDSKISTKVGAIDGTVKDYVDTKTAGIASDTALKELSEKVTAAEGAIEALEGLVGEKAVGTQISEAITELDLANTYEAKGEAAKVQEEVDALELKVGTVPEGKDVVTMISEAQEAATYDDTEVKADIEALEGLVGTTAVATQISEAVAAEKTRAEGVEGGLETRLKAVENDYLKAADKEALEGADEAMGERIGALEGQITGLSGAMHFKGVEDVLPEDVSAYVDGDVIIVGEKEYVFNDGAFVLFGDVSAEGERLAALESKVGEKAVSVQISEAIAAENLSQYATEADLTLAEGRIETLESKFGAGEGTVETQIAKAKQEAIEAAAADAETKANAAKSHADDLNTAMNTRVEALEAVDHEHSNKEVLDGITAAKVADWDDAVAKEHEHANKEELDKILAGDKAKWDAAEAKAHEHANKVVLDGVSAEKVAAWDAAEGNAKAHAEAKITEALTWGSF